ncbi:LLM class flavin-dependent oxidoreductase [Embleya sp. NPDC050493]|uniref:LLM class flavin-dependent oxidoreductase n=1 Tax=Embleya sp. NPDC050493 TaxID=3363989 RepID=UPI0037B2DDAD
MRLSTVILPIHRWTEGRKVWRRAEDLGFHAAYTYDHLSWRSFREHPWFGAVPTLTAAATATERLRLGTMVTSPNFRHPVTLAKDLAAIDDISCGRLIAGIGAGGTGFDATALGGQPWSPRERADRLAEFVPLLDRLLSEPAVTQEGTYYTANDVRMIPSGRQRPRVPMYIAATGPRGMRLTARHGEGWITYGDPRDAKTTAARDCPAVIAEQLERLSDICAAEGRKPEELAKVLLQGSTPERPLDSLDAFVDYAGRYRELGITELVLHWPVPDSVFAADQAVFERIATEGLRQLD